MFQRLLGIPGEAAQGLGREDHPVRPCLGMSSVGVCPMPPRPRDSGGALALLRDLGGVAAKPKETLGKTSGLSLADSLRVLPVAGEGRQSPLLSSSLPEAGGPAALFRPNHPPTPRSSPLCRWVSPGLCLAWPWVPLLGAPRLPHSSCGDVSMGAVRGPGLVDAELTTSPAPESRHGSEGGPAEAVLGSVHPDPRSPLGRDPWSGEV